MFRRDPPSETGSRLGDRPGRAGSGLACALDPVCGRADAPGEPTLRSPRVGFGAGIQPPESGPITDDSDDSVSFAEFTHAPGPENAIIPAVSAAPAGSAMTLSNTTRLSCHGRSARCLPEATSSTLAAPYRKRHWQRRLYCLYFCDKESTGGLLVRWVRGDLVRKRDRGAQYAGRRRDRPQFPTQDAASAAQTACSKRNQSGRRASVHDLAPLPLVPGSRRCPSRREWLPEVCASARSRRGSWVAPALARRTARGDPR